MDNIRCVLADIPQVALADIIQKIIEARPGIEVIGRVENNNELLNYLNNESVDVVIHNMDAINSPQGIDRVLQQSPQTISVGLVESGRRICVCVQDIGPDELSNLIEEVNKICR